MIKKLFILLVLISFIANSVNAIEAQQETSQSKDSIKFIYLNGSNSNKEKDKFNFTKGAYKMQSAIKEVLEEDEFVAEKFLVNKTYKIDKEPDILFWGFQSKNELTNINNTLSVAKMVSPKFAQSVRSLLAHCMHDALWVQKGFNMPKIVNQLHKMVMENYEKGHKVVLSGHSAGSFVTFEYLVRKLKAVNIAQMFNNPEGKDYCTCVDAISASGYGYQLSTGKFVVNPNETQRKEAFKNLDNYTRAYCAPDDAIAGIVNFGSPLSLFYSSQLSGNLDSSSMYQYAFLEYMAQKNIFFLTVNFADDPIGFPVGNNVSASDIEMKFNKTLPKDSIGFMYNFSSKKSPATFVGSHFSYWKHPKKYADMVKEGYIKGYKNFYSQYL